MEKPPQDRQHRNEFVTAAVNTNYKAWRHGATSMSSMCCSVTTASYLFCVAYPQKGCVLRVDAECKDLLASLETNILDNTVSMILRHRHRATGRLAKQPAFPSTSFPITHSNSGEGLLFYANHHSFCDRFPR